MLQTFATNAQKPELVYSVAQIRQLEQAICLTNNITPPELMAKVGKALYDFFAQRWPDANQVKVFVGPGHNGGDGWVFARHALQHDKSVSVVTVLPIEYLEGDLAEVAATYVADGGVVSVWPDQGRASCDVVVDGLLGIGAQGTLRSPYDAIVEAINRCDAQVLAIDVPTGLNADTGEISLPCVHAQVTATVLGLKWGLVTGNALGVVGELAVLPLDEVASPNNIPTNGVHLTQGRMPLPKRQPNCHKGDFGRVLLVGGLDNMPGAICLAAEAAARVGAGYVQVASHSKYLGQVLSKKSDFLLLPLEDDMALSQAIEQASAILIGPGLGQGRLAKQVLAKVLTSSKPKLLDADALNLLAETPMALDNALITPHPGEAARLLAKSSSWVQVHRKETLQALAEKYQAAVVLKGAGTLMQDHQGHISVCGCGNPGMAVAGMGDVLGGMIVGLVAQGLPMDQAMVMGVMNHAGISDSLVAQSGEAGLMASDLLLHLSAWINADVT